MKITLNKLKSPFIFNLLIWASSNLCGANYYWVGGSGSWSDLTHWATSSGGNIYHNQVPTFQDDVFFDVNSFPSTGEAVNLNVSNAVCKSLIWNGVKNKPKFTSSDKSYFIRIYGDLQLDKNMDFAYDGFFTFESTSTGNKITTANFKIQKFEFKGLNGEWTLQDSLKLYGDVNGWGLVLYSGHVKTNNKVLQLRSFITTGNNWRKLTLGNSIVNLVDGEGGWYAIDNNFHLDAGKSQINMLYKDWRKSFYHRVQSPKSVFYNLKVEYKYPRDVVGDNFNCIDSTSFNKIEIKSTVNDAELNGINVKTLICYERVDNMRLNFAKIGRLVLNNSSFLDGSFTTDTLSLKGGATYEFGGGQIITVNKLLNWKGSCGRHVNIRSNTPGTPVEFVINTLAAQNIDYCRLHHLKFTGTSTVTATNHIATTTVTGLGSTNNLATKFYFWVGQTGKWSDPANWSYSSGGPGQTCIPGPLDNVIFDKNSFTNNLDTLYLDLRENTCFQINYAATANTSVFHSTDSNTLRTTGNIQFYTKPENDMKGKWIINNSASTVNSLKSSNFPFSRLEIDCETATSGVELLDSLTVVGFNDGVHNEALTLKSGVLVTKNQSVNTRRFASYGHRSREIKMGTSNWYSKDAWEPAWYVEGSKFKMDSTNYHIQIYRTDWRKVFYHFSQTPYVKYNKVSFQDLVQNPQGTDLIRVNDSAGFGELNLKSYVGELSIERAVVNKLNCYEKVLYQNSQGAKINSARYYKDVAMYGNTLFDSLIFYPGSANQFQKGNTQTVSKYLGIKGNCRGLISLTSSEKGELTSFDYKKDTAHGDYLALQDIEGLGTAKYIAKNASNRGGNKNWNISLLTGRTYYWVNDSGMWSNPNHWSLTSGGSPSGCIPSQLDNVIFDGNSFSKNGEIVYIDVENASCNNMTWDFTVRPAVFKGPYTSTLKIFGDLRLRPNVDYKLEGFVNLEATDTGNAIYPYFKPIVRLNIVGTGSWRLYDSLQVIGDRDQWGIMHTSGTFITQGNFVRMRKYYSYGEADRHWNMVGSYVEANNPPDNGWEVHGKNFYLSADRSHLVIKRKDWRKAFYHLSTYPRVKFNKISFLDKCSNPQGTDYFRATDSLEFNELYFESYLQELSIPYAKVGKIHAKEKVYGQYSDVNPNVENRNHIKHATIRYAKYENECDFFGYQIFDTLQLNPGGIYKFENQKSFTVNKLFDAVGNSCFPITIQSTLVNNVDTLKFSSTTNTLIDFVEMRDQLALSPIQQKIGSNSVDVSGNKNWIFENTTKQNLGIGPDTMLCQGDSITLNTNFYKGAFGYLWSNGTTKPTLKIKTSGEYWVKVTFTYRGDTCWKYDTCKVAFTPLKLNTSTYNATCSTSFDGRAKVKYNGLNALKSWKWSNGSSTDSVSNLKSGLNFITATDLKGCSRTDTVMINFNLFNPQPLPIDTQYCSIGINKLTLYNIDSSNYSGEWFDANKMSLKSNSNHFQFKQHIGDSFEGFFAFNNKNGCVGPLVPVTVKGIVILDSQDITAYDARCINSLDGSLKITYNGFRPIDRFVWSNNQLGDTLSGLLKGPYKVQIVGSDGCISEDSSVVGYQILQPPAPIDTVVCEKSEVLLNIPHIPGFVIKWMDTNGLVVDTGSNHKVQIFEDSIVKFAQYLSPLGCLSDTSRMKINVRPLPPKPVFSSNLTLCLNQPYSLNVTGTNVRWYKSMNDTSGTDTVPVPRVDSLFRQVFYLTQNDGSCTSLKDSIVATVNNYGVSTNTDTSIYKGYGIFLTANGAQSYSWRPFIGLSDSTGDVVLAEPHSSICYVVYGKAANGCVGTDTVCITVLDPYSVKLPNIISPNGDALNQTWRIDMLPEFEKYEVTIMDRQGAVVMKKSPYDNSFNGSDSDGKELENGVYFYYLRHTEQDIKFKGYIQVIR